MNSSNESKTGIIFNIQKFSVNDGPGIRTVVFIKGCPMHCRWCSNPESQYPQPQMLWEQKKCVSCHRCVALCPESAVSLSDGRIHIEASLCIGCGQCAQTCPGSALTLEGSRKTVQQVMEVVMQDLPFYEESGGGLTLSGGEMLSQPQFATALLLAAKENGLHTCCETTGFADTEVFDRVTAHADMLLFDMKHWDTTKHREGTGVSNELPLLNMKRAIERGKTVLPRIPVIPGFNDALADAAGFARALHEVGAKQCQLLPFHQFGENKYHLLGVSYSYEDVPSLHREDLQDYLQVLLDSGIEAFF